MQITSECRRATNVFTQRSVSFIGLINYVFLEFFWKTQPLQHVGSCNLCRHFNSHHMFSLFILTFASMAALGASALGNLDSQDLHRLQRLCTGRGLCSRTRKPHFKLTGSNHQGIPWTRVAQPYPSGLCRDLASSLTSPSHYNPPLQ